MTLFSYKAMEPGGKPTSGTIAAIDEAEAIRRLAGSGYTVLELGAGRPSGDVSPSGRFLPALNIRGSVDQVQLFADLALLTGAGLTVSKALETLAKSGSTPVQANAAGSVLNAISAGGSASDAFRKIQGISEASIAMISSGESNRNLQKAFATLARQLGQDAKDRSKVLNALAYPVFLIALMFLAFSIVTFVLVPAIEPAFENTGKALPFPIRVFSSIRQASEVGGPVLAMTVVALALTFVFGPTRGILGRACLSAIINAPLIGSFLQDQQLARYLSSLSMLLDNGAMLSRSLETANSTVTHPHLRAKLEAALRLVTGGVPLPEALEQQKVFDGRILSVLAVGFEAGKLGFAAGQGAEILEQRSRRRADRSLAILTPAITVGMGLAIGGLILSVMTALLSINEIAVQ